MAASDQQVQNFVDRIIRPGCQAFVAICTFLDLAGAQIGDIAANLANPATTWVDSRGDGPPHLATPQDILTVGAALSAFRRFRSGDASQAASDYVAMAAAMPVIVALCVNIPTITVQS